VSERGPTSHDVAREAGVSQSAVSRAFTPGASVSPEMRATIEAAAARLGYRPSRLPGIMRSGKSGIVAVVVGGLYNPFHTMTLEAFTRALKAAGKQTLLVQVDSDRDLDEAVNELVALRIDGVLSALSLSSRAMATELDRHRLPIVVLNSPFESEWVRVVSSDNRGAGQRAAELLVHTGCRRPAWIVGPAEAPGHAERAEGFVATLNAVGMLDVAGLHGQYGYEWGRDAASSLLERTHRPDGLFCGNDLIAAGVIDRWAEAGLTAPRDFRIIGYDDVPTAAWAHYQLTSFDQDVDRMATLAVELLENRPGIQQTPLIVRPHLIRRRSC